MADTVNAATLADLFSVTTRTITPILQSGASSSVRAKAMRWRRASGPQAEHVELKNKKARGELVAAADVENEWSGIPLMLAVPSRVSQRLPHLTAHDVAEIDAEVRATLNELGSTGVPSSLSTRK